LVRLTQLQIEDKKLEEATENVEKIKNIDKKFKPALILEL